MPCFYTPFSRFQLGIKGVPQAVAEQVQGQHNQRNGKCGNDHTVGVAAQAVEGLGGQTAQRGHGSVDAQTQIGQEALGKDGAGNLQGGGDDDDADAVGDQVLCDDPASFGAGRAGSQHIFLFFQAEDLAANLPGHADPIQQSEHNEQGNHIGAQPVPPSLIRRWKQYFPHHKYDTNYGLSESTGPGCVHLGLDNIDKVGSIGIPGYRWSCKIVDENGNEVKQGEVGELCVKGPGVMTCYYNDPKATAETLKNGWLYTGDMAMQDEDGFYFLVDRKKDVIVSGGENIYPVQIENFLSAYETVQDVAVIGLPDSRLGEITGAVIQVKDGMECTEEEINEYCQKLPRYKRPKKVIFAEVPRNATGKIEKPALRKKYGAEHLVAQQNLA